MSNPNSLVRWVPILPLESGSMGLCLWLFDEKGPDELEFNHGKVPVVAWLKVRIDPSEIRPLEILETVRP